jgi:V8-like Glu-specific endopeptidase
LLNDSANSFTPHFLTAAHCVSTQAVASTLETYWFYRSSSCNSQTLNPGMRTLVGGAVLLRTDSSTDVTLVKLNNPPPAGAYYSGWSASPPTFSSVVGIHHPEGDLQKISHGALDDYYSCSSDAFGEFSCIRSDITTSNFVNVTFALGATEPGSSGSPLYRTVSGSRYLTGQLYGGDSSCSNRGGSNEYGRFDVSYRKGLNAWLGGNVTTAGSSAASGAGASGRSAVYRFYNSQTGAHFYTISAVERDSVIANLKQFHYDGPAFYSYTQPGTDLSPVYRFYNTQSGAHFYTINSAERDSVIANLPQFRYEGPVWYARQTAGGNATALYRFFRTTNSAHFYTPDPAERDYVINNLSDFRYEGPAYYVWTGP